MTIIESPQLTGCDELREWLLAQGFQVARLQYDNECNWYAYRRSELPARECEFNDGKPMQLVVRPYRFPHPSAPGGAWESAEVDVIGEAGGLWFTLQAYLLSHQAVRERLGDIERSLISAWNALR